MNMEVYKTAGPDLSVKVSIIFTFHFLDLSCFYSAMFVFILCLGIRVFTSRWLLLLPLLQKRFLEVLDQAGPQLVPLRPESWESGWKQWKCYDFTLILLQESQTRTKEQNTSSHSRTFKLILQSQSRHTAQHTNRDKWDVFLCPSIPLSLN